MLRRLAVGLEMPERIQRDDGDRELPERAAGVVAARVEWSGEQPDEGDVEQAEHHDGDRRDPGEGARRRCMPDAEEVRSWMAGESGAKEIRPPLSNVALDGIGRDQLSSQAPLDEGGAAPRRRQSAGR